MPEPAILDQERLSRLRLAGATVLGAGLVLSRLPLGVGLPCPLRTVTGVPCPLCGMTTSVREAMGGDVVAALGANPAGVVLVAAVIALIVMRPSRLRLPAVPVMVVVAVTAAMWAFQLHRFGYV